MGSTKKQVTFRLDPEVVTKMEDVRKVTGVSVSTQIELSLKGYEIRKIESKKEGT